MQEADMLRIHCQAKTTIKKHLFALLILLTACTSPQTEPAGSPTAEHSVTEQQQADTSDTLTITTDSIDTDGFWNELISHDRGTDSSPHLSWDNVPDAACYAVYMIDPDGNNWVHMKAVTYDHELEWEAVPPLSAKNADSGDKKEITVKGKYIGPYPPSGTHTYNVYVVALKHDVNDVNDLPEALNTSMKLRSADELIAALDTLNNETGNVICCGVISGKYSKK